MARSEYSVEELVNMMTKGDLRLPAMQRKYVWPATRVRDLLDSLYRGYPSGAILMWDSSDEVPIRETALAQGTPSGQPRLLLDGQQRITSLSAVLRGEPVYVKGRKRPIDILFNLQHPDDLEVVTEVDEGSENETIADDDHSELEHDEIQKRLHKRAFVVGTNKLKALPHWVSVSDVFMTDSDAPFLKAAGITDFSDPRYEKYSQRLAKVRAIRKYSYRVDILEDSMSYEEVTEIFVRVNSLGAKLRSADLALAQITSKWRDSLDEFEAYQDRCRRDGFDLDLAIHLKALVAMSTGQSRFKTVGSISVDSMKAGWEDAKAGMDYAINFLKTNVKIESPGLLASPFILIALAAYGRDHDYAIAGDDSELLRKWVLVANAKGRYSRGSTETLLDQDLATIRSGGGPAGLLERLKAQVGRLDFTPQELEGRNVRSAVFKEMFLAFRSAGATDWETQLEISLSHSGARDRLQFHHIFPKAFLKTAFDERQADDIANQCFISARTNQRISDTAPTDYLPSVISAGGEQALRFQCVPTDAALWGLSAYPEFLIARRQLIAERINEHVGLDF